MSAFPFRTALIIGAGSGITASLARMLAASACRVGLAARDAGRLTALAGEIGGAAFAADAADPEAMERLFRDADERIGEPEVVIYNAGARTRGRLTELEPEGVRKALAVNAFGGFLATRLAARRMVPNGHGAILFTGATASLKGFAQSAPFAMGKFALRGLAQSAARELGPFGIHVAHVVIDGAVRSAVRPDPADRPDSTLSPDGIASACLDLLRQPRDAWSFEIDLRPWGERF